MEGSTRQRSVSDYRQVRPFVATILATEKEILQMRLGTIIKEKESEEKKDLAKIREEYACKTKLERTNRDIRMAELNHKLQFKSELSLQRLKYTVDSLESGINRFFSDRKTRTVAVRKLLSGG